MLLLNDQGAPPKPHDKALIIRPWTRLLEQVPLPQNSTIVVVNVRGSRSVVRRTTGLVKLETLFLVDDVVIAESQVVVVNMNSDRCAQSPRYVIDIPLICSRLARYSSASE